MRKHKIRNTLCAIAVVIIVIAAYLCLHNPGAAIGTWVPDENFSVRDEEATVIEAEKLLSLNISPYKDPETIQLSGEWIYAAVEGGEIIRLKEDGSGLESVLQTGGSILGFDLDSQGTIYFCDCNYEGSPAICKYDGKAIEKLPIGGLTYPDALCIDESRHLLYFSNASEVCPADLSLSPQDAYMIDMMACTKTGSIGCFDLESGEQTAVTDGFHFANGLQLSPDGNELLINETSGNHIWKTDLATGEKNLLLTVPGYPDNLHRTSDGYWSGLAGSYAASYADLADKPLLRKFLLNLPGPLFALFTGSSGEADVQFVKYTPDGTVLEYNIIRGMGFTTTGIVETDQRVYFETISGIDKIYYYEK